MRTYNAFVGARILFVIAIVATSLAIAIDGWQLRDLFPIIISWGFWGFGFLCWLNPDYGHW